MSKNLLYEIMDLPNPEALVKEVLDQIEREKIQRKAFREWVRPDVKAEFINGEVISHSPALRRNNQAVKFLLYILETYIQVNELGEVAVEKAMVELDRSDLEPDVVYWNNEISDNFEDEMLYYPPPNFVVEVLSKGTQSRDRGVKMRAYEEAGVEEYWLVDPKKHQVEQYTLKKDAKDDLVYALLQTHEINEQIDCIVVEGLQIPVRAIFDRKANHELAMRLMTGGEM